MTALKSSKYFFLLLIVLFHIEHAIGACNRLKQVNFEQKQLLEIGLVDGRIIIIQFRSKIDNGIRGVIMNKYKKQYIVTDEFIEINYDKIRSCKKISNGISKKAILLFVALGASTLLYMLWVQNKTSITLE